MIARQQKMYVHIYADAAMLSNAEYRALLVRHSGCSTAADPDFGQRGFDQVMAALETILFQRVDSGLVRNPIGRSRWIRSRDYWRRRTLAARNGLINSRQLHKIQALWRMLAPAAGFPEPESHDAIRYLGGLIARATGRSAVGDTALTAGEAACVLDALQDRLSHALQTPAPAGSKPLQSPGRSQLADSTAPPF